MIGSLRPLLSVFILTATTAPAADDSRPDERRRIREALFVPETLPPLEARVHGHFEPEPGVVAERISYRTAYGLRVPAILYRPTLSTGPLPAIVIVNGHGGDKFSWYSFYSGVLYARAGAVVLTYDPIGEGERNERRASGTRAHDQVQSPPELACRLSGLMITDVMQAVSYLRARPEVAPGRIAAVGYSMGSFVLSLAGALEQRLHACVLAGGGNLDGIGEYWDRSKPMCQGLPYQSLSFLGDRGARLYAMHAARGPTLVYNGLEDEIVRHDPRGPEAFFADLQGRTRALAGGQPVFAIGFEPAAGHRPWFVTKPVARWLEEQVDFPQWSFAAIDGMPVTHVSAWAQATGVAIDPLYATEKREGGAQALGRDVPALSRAQLSVFTAAEWTTEKSRLTYEAWLQAARSELRGTGLPGYDVQRAAGVITIDGILDDAPWQRAAPMGPFHFHWWTAGEKEPTEVKMLWDDENLYLAYRCTDRHISAQVVARHGPVSNDDCVELFLAPNPSKVRNYYTFEINAIGAMLNRCRTDWWSGPPTWEPEGMRHATSLPRGVIKQESAEDREWTVEMAVPLRNFARDAAHTPPRPGDVWRLNLNRTGGLTNKQASSWSPIPAQVRSFHTPTAFGMIRFVDTPAR